jgi:hypothetical protein
MRKKRMRKDEKREVTPEFVNMSKEILYPQIQGVTPTDPSAARFQGGVQSSNSQQYCARVEAYLLRNILP